MGFKTGLQICRLKIHAVHVVQPAKTSIWATPVMPETSSALRAGNWPVEGGGGDRGFFRGRGLSDQGLGMGGGLLRGLFMWAVLNKCLSPVQLHRCSRMFAVWQARHMGVGDWV